MSIVKVAQLAGCSHMTVSRVINQHPGVSEQAATRVQEAMRQLNYTPPAVRRGPPRKARRTKQTHHVALLMFGTEAAARSAPVANAAIQAVGDALAARSYSMTLSQVHDESRIPAAVSRGGIDGLILHGHPPSQALADKLKRFPAVWMMSPRSESGYWGDRVSPDNRIIGQQAAKYLIGRGHRRVGFLSIDATHLGFHDRLAGFQQTAAAAQVSCHAIRRDASSDDPAGDFRAQRATIDQLIDSFAELEDRPTGLFVPRGQAILMVFEALRSRGIQPGRDVTIIACDNDPALSGLTPPIATIDVRPELIGQQAVEQLLTRIQKPGQFTRSTIMVEPRLIEPTDAAF